MMVGRVLLFVNCTATMPIKTYDTLFPYTALFRSSVEAAHVSYDDGLLAYLADEIPRLGDGGRAGFLAQDDLHHRHLLDRREEMDADEILRLRPCPGQQIGRAHV